MVNTTYDSGMLAYLGDAVWELFARERLFSTVAHGNKKANRLALDIVTAAAQCRALDVILPHLTEEEEEVFKWGRNTKVHSVPRTASVADYRRATGLEVLFGYLHAEGRDERCRELFKIAFETK
jgi:ribonuclease-3 family protein